MLLTNTIQALTIRIQTILSGVVRVLRVRPAAAASFAVAEAPAWSVSRRDMCPRSRAGRRGSHRAPSAWDESPGLRAGRTRVLPFSDRRS